MWLTEKGKNAKGRIGEPGVKIPTMHGSKGLQCKAVILMFADDCPRADSDEAEERRLFYVALTRAEDYLAIYCSKKSPARATVSTKFTPVAPSLRVEKSE